MKLNCGAQAPLVHPSLHVSAPPFFAEPWLSDMSGVSDSVRAVSEGVSEDIWDICPRCPMCPRTYVRCVRR